MRAEVRRGQHGSGSCHSWENCLEDAPPTSGRTEAQRQVPRRAGRQTPAPPNPLALSAGPRRPGLPSAFLLSPVLFPKLSFRVLRSQEVTHGRFQEVKVQQSTVLSSLGSCGRGVRGEPSGSRIPAPPGSHLLPGRRACRRDAPPAQFGAGGQGVHREVGVFSSLSSGGGWQVAAL